MKKIYIAYCGKYNNAIGPIKSMNVIFDLLSKHFYCVKSNNLIMSKSKKIISISSFPDNKRSYLRNLLKGLLSPFIDLFYILFFNFSVSLNFYNKDVIIITQPFLIIPVHCFGKKLIYTRRGNIPDKVFLSNSLVKRIFEYFFYRIQEYKTVFLVPQLDNSLFIPNAFPIRKITINGITSKKTIFFAGTWNKRKGAHDMTYLFNESIITNLVVFGEIHEEFPIGAEHRGIVANPSDHYEPGDIFLSLSTLEGLQRSVIEALLKGCFVICYERPDSIFLNTSPLVFIANDINDIPSILQRINSIGYLEYKKLYENSFDFLNSNLSEYVVEEKWLSII